ncbi:MAG: DUF971 domain-containing protein [Pyrinomonadaceae bacterium]
MVEPLQIIEESDSEITIAWSDARENSYAAADLRRACPCAGCVNEWNGERTLKPETVADDLSFSSIAVVGRYALNFNFSDGHDTGIYSFKYLREIAEK